MRTRQPSHTSTDDVQPRIGAWCRLPRARSTLSAVLVATAFALAAAVLTITPAFAAGPTQQTWTQNNWSGGAGQIAWPGTSSSNQYNTQVSGVAAPITGGVTLAHYADTFQDSRAVPFPACNNSGSPWASTPAYGGAVVGPLDWTPTTACPSYPAGQAWSFSPVENSAYFAFDYSVPDCLCLSEGWHLTKTLPVTAANTASIEHVDLYVPSIAAPAPNPAGDNNITEEISWTATGTRNGRLQSSDVELHVVADYQASPTYTLSVGVKIYDIPSASYVYVNFANVGSFAPDQWNTYGVIQSANASSFSFTLNGAALATYTPNPPDGQPFWPTTGNLMDEIDYWPTSWNTGSGLMGWLYTRNFDQYTNDHGEITSSNFTAGTARDKVLAGMSWTGTSVAPNTTDISLSVNGGAYGASLTGGSASGTSTFGSVVPFQTLAYDAKVTGSPLSQTANLLNSVSFNYYNAPDVTALTVNGTTITSNGQSLYSTTTTPSFTATTTDSTSGFYSIDGGAWVGTGNGNAGSMSGTTTALSQGTHTLCVMTEAVYPSGSGSYDTSVCPAAGFSHGAPTAATWVTLVVDTTPPVSSVTSCSATSALITASDNLSGVASIQYQLDGGAWTPIANGGSVVITAAAHTFTTQATDNAGNIEVAHNTGVNGVATSGPVLHCWSQNDWSGGAGQVNWPGISTSNKYNTQDFPVVTPVGSIGLPYFWDAMNHNRGTLAPPVNTTVGPWPSSGTTEFPWTVTGSCSVCSHDATDSVTENGSTLQSCICGMPQESGSDDIFYLDTTLPNAGKSDHIRVEETVTLGAIPDPVFTGVGLGTTNELFTGVTVSNGASCTKFVFLGVNGHDASGNYAPYFYAAGAYYPTCGSGVGVLQTWVPNFYTPTAGVAYDVAITADDNGNGTTTFGAFVNGVQKWTSTVAFGSISAGTPTIVNAFEAHDIGYVGTWNYQTWMKDVKVYMSDSGQVTSSTFTAGTARDKELAGTLWAGSGTNANNILYSANGGAYGASVTGGAASGYVTAASVTPFANLNYRAQVGGSTTLGTSNTLTVVNSLYYNAPDVTALTVNGTVVTSNGQSLYSGATPSFTATTTDSTSGFYSIDGGAWVGTGNGSTGSMSGTTTALTEGTHTLCVMTEAVYPSGAGSYDTSVCPAAGFNHGAPTGFTWVTLVVDTTPPVTTITPGGVANSNAPWWKTSSVTLSCNDGAGSGCKTTTYTVDAGLPTVYAGPFALADGVHTIAAWSTDNALNLESPGPTATVKVDSVAPSVPAAPTVGTGGSGIANISWSASTDATSGMGTYQAQAYDTVTHVTTTSGWVATLSTTISGLSNGDPIQFSVRAQDVAGNISAYGATTTYTLDNVPPTTTLATTPAAARWHQRLVHLRPDGQIDLRG